MPRFFVSKEQIKTPYIYVEGKDVNHIKNVLRMSVEDELTVSDGDGTDYFGVIEQIEEHQIMIKIVDSWKSFVELDTKITLFQGLPKGDKMELIIQKAVELGAYEIVPVSNTRCIVRLDDKKAKKKIERWQEISKGAAKQSGRALVPKVHMPMTFKTAIEYSQTFDLVMIPYEKAKNMQETREVIKSVQGKNHIGVFIGPEGGFDEREIELAMTNAIVPITLGHRILRTETAGLTILSVLMFELDQ